MSSLNYDKIVAATSAQIVPCTRPWTTIEERSLDGDFEVCCFGKTFLGNIGKNSNDDIAELINCHNAVEMRQSMADGKLPSACPPDCDIIKRRAKLNHSDFYEYDSTEYETFGEAFRSNREKLISHIANKSVILDTFPLKFKLLPSYTCNLKCPMCNVKNLPAPSIGQNYYENLYKLMPFLEEIVIFGGEPFACKTTRSIVFGNEIRKYPQIHFSTITNGTLLNDKLLEKLKRIRLGWLSISLDSCKAETYEQLRIGARFAKTMANLEGLVKARDSGALRVRDITVSFVIQRLNYTQIKEYIELAHSLKVMPKLSLVGGSDELADVVDDVRENMEQGLAKAEELKNDYAIGRLKMLLGKLPEYKTKVTALKRQNKTEKMVRAVPGGKAIADWIKGNKVMKRLAKTVINRR